MLTPFLLLIIMTILTKYIIDYIKILRTGDPNENDQNYWKFSYDFKPSKKQDYIPDSIEFLKRKRFRNKLVFLFYVNILIIFLLANYLASQILDNIFN